MEPWEVRQYIEKMLDKEDLYGMYSELCLKVEAVPISKEAFVDAYIDVVNRRQELHDSAVASVQRDKTLLLDALEKARAPLEDLVSVQSLPPSVTITLNALKDGVICLYVIFPSGPEKPTVIPAYVADGKESQFL